MISMPSMMGRCSRAAARVLAVATTLLFLSSTMATGQKDEGPRRLVILAINDVYRIDGVAEGTSGGLARVRSLRANLERNDPAVLVLLAGDFLFPSMLSRQYEGEQMIDVLNLLDGDERAFDQRMFVTFGNHEFQKSRKEDASLLQARIEDSQFRWVGSNVVFEKDENGRPLVASHNLKSSVIVETGGIRVGIFSITTDFKRTAYVKEFLAPQETARRMTRDLRRQGAELVIALTHLLRWQDVAVLEALGQDGPDLIIGGHEHTKKKREVDGRWIINSDSDARTAAVVSISLPREGHPVVQPHFEQLESSSPPPDPVVQARVEQWVRRHDLEYCTTELNRQAGCLNEILGKAKVTLVGEELEIRRYETNLGNWLVDLARREFAGEKAQAAFINAGTFRLNEDIPAGTAITRRHIEQLFAYPTPLALLRIDGATLNQVVTRAVREWSGNGWWLQVSGLAFHHDPATETADRVTLLTADGPRLVKPDEELLVVTNGFLAKGNDGYQMLSPDHVVQSGRDVDLKEIAVRALLSSEPEGIAPAVEGRICNPNRDGPCLAVPIADAQPDRQGRSTDRLFER